MGMLEFLQQKNRREKGFLTPSLHGESRSNLGLYKLVQGNRNQSEPSPFLRIKPLLRFGKGLGKPHPINPHNLPFHTYLSANSFQQECQENSFSSLHHGKISGWPTNSPSCIGQVPSCSMGSLPPFVSEQRARLLETAYLFESG